MIYLYAITDRPEAAIPGLPGLEDAPLISLAYRDIAAVAGRSVELSATATRSSSKTVDVWRHEAIVEALMPDRTVLPVRFGTVLPDEAALRSMLKDRYSSFVANLKRVCGRVELGVQVLWDSDSRPLTAGRAKNINDQCSAIGGRAYMLARLSEEQLERAWRRRAETLVVEIRRPLEHMAADSVCQVLVTPRLLLKAAYLVAREQMKNFRKEINNLSLAYPELRFLCTGPWPAYNFVTDRKADQSGD